MPEPTFTPRYCSTTDVLNILGLVIGDISQGETQLKHWIVAMENYVDKMTHRNFVALGTATSKFYDKVKPEYLYIDECVDIDFVKINGVELAEADYVLEPYNEMPIRKIVFATPQHFGHGKKAIEVSAKWGYSVACPEPIIYAVAVLVGGIIRGFKAKANSIKSEKVGDYSVTYDTENVSQLAEADSIIKQYKKVYV